MGCEKAEGSDILEIDRKKYLVPQELIVGQFVYVVRKRLRLPPEKAIFIFVDGHLPSTGAALMSQMYKDYKAHPPSPHPRLTLASPSLTLASIHLHSPPFTSIPLHSPPFPSIRLHSAASTPAAVTCCCR